MITAMHAILNEMSSLSIRISMPLRVEIEVAAIIIVSSIPGAIAPL